MSIALSAELLMNIANSRKRFENECNLLKANLLELGQIYILKIQDEEYFKSLIMDVDFQNRSVFWIITECKLEPLLPDGDMKVENILNDIYVGSEANQCDGTLFGFSTFLHILTSKVKKKELASAHEEGKKKN
jgi:hypothetical protein